jgi:hypothetical protein
MYKNVQKKFSYQDVNVRGYAVLVSEIMLQQTQVATVIQYYKYDILQKKNPGIKFNTHFLCVRKSRLKTQKRTFEFGLSPENDGK